MNEEVKVDVELDEEFVDETLVCKECGNEFVFTAGEQKFYKEKGFTSFDVVAKLRGILHTRKIGHTGTLDPDAEGVLPVCVGRATRLFDYIIDKQKEYIAELRLGTVTDTQDATGAVLYECDASHITP